MRAEMGPLATAVQVSVSSRAWSTWRRRHQHQARASHRRRRQALYDKPLLSYQKACGCWRKPVPSGRPTGASRGAVRVRERGLAGADLGCVHDSCSSASDPIPH